MTILPPMLGLGFQIWSKPTGPAFHFSMKAGSLRCLWLPQCGNPYTPGGILRGRIAPAKASSLGRGLQSFLWSGNTAHDRKDQNQTAAADSTIGSQRCSIKFITL